MTGAVMQRDEQLLQYATPAQAKKIQAIWEHGSMRAAARALGINYSAVHKSFYAVQTKAAMHGYSPDHDLTHPVAPGQRLKGASTLYKDGVQVMQWVKSTADQDRIEDIRQSIIKALTEDIRPVRALKPPKTVDAELWVNYPVGDHHLGMYAWHEEAGGDWSLEKGERVLMSALSHLVDSAPPAHGAAIILLGDFLHTDGKLPVTPTSQHVLDADSRYQKIVRIALRSVVAMVQQALKKHNEVRLIIETGNHDESGTVWLQESMALYYANEPRVTVDRSPKVIHAFKFGKNLICTHHGHKTKAQDLPLLIATDWAEWWGGTEYRYCYTGHVHHTDAKDFNGVKVESFRILPPTDAYAHGMGYRSQSDMQSIVLHREWGEVGRTRFNPRMLEA